MAPTTRSSTAATRFAGPRRSTRTRKPAAKLASQATVALRVSNPQKRKHAPSTARFAKRPKKGPKSLAQRRTNVSLPPIQIPSAISSPLSSAPATADLQTPTAATPEAMAPVSPLAEPNDGFYEIVDGENVVGTTWLAVPGTRLAPINSYLLWEMREYVGDKDTIVVYTKGVLINGE